MGRFATFAGLDGNFPAAFGGEGISSCKAGFPPVGVDQGEAGFEVFHIGEDEQEPPFRRLGVIGAFGKEVTQFRLWPHVEIGLICGSAAV